MQETIHVIASVRELEEQPISVCMTVYNGAYFLKEYIGRVLPQSFNDFQLFFFDDWSTDNSVDIILWYKDERIRLFKNKHDDISCLNLLSK